MTNSTGPLNQMIDSVAGCLLYTNYWRPIKQKWRNPHPTDSYGMLSISYANRLLKIYETIEPASVKSP